MSDLFPDTREPAPLMVVPPQRDAEPRMLNMPDDEMTALLLALDNVRFGFGGAGRIASQARGLTIDRLSVKMRNAVIGIGWRYRRQLPDAVVRSLQRARSAR